MVFWTIAIAVTVLACAALYYAAAGRAVNAAAGVAGDPVTAHHRLQLSELEADIAAGRLGEAEGVAAKGELAREVLRLRGETKSVDGGRPGRAVIALSVAVVAVIAVATYAAMGKPDLPSAPLAGRDLAGDGMTLEQAVARVEQQLMVTPDDVRGWGVLAPIYMQAGRFADAERAYRRILALSPPTADAETDLAEALMMQNGGVVSGETRALLESAAARDPAHVRSRFYLAGEATRSGDFTGAKTQWDALVAMAKPGDTWLEAAQQGLAAAEQGLAGGTVPGVDEATIRTMVESLDARLTSDGGTIEEWTQLVRSRLVLGEEGQAQLAYDAAIAAYPDPAQRLELDDLARGANLKGVDG
jgi:cytochrome c-type biogenesis protein CcmH